MKEVSNRIHKLFEEHDASYGDVSEKTGIPKSALHRYATGQTPKIPIDRIEKIAEFFHVSAAYIMGWETEEPPAGTDGSDQISRAMEIYNSLSPEKRAAADEYLSFLLKSQQTD